MEAHPSDPLPIGRQETVTELIPARCRPGFNRSNGKVQRASAALIVACCVGVPDSEINEVGCEIGGVPGCEMGKIGGEIGCGVG